MEVSNLVFYIQKTTEYNRSVSESAADSARPNITRTAQTRRTVSKSAMETKVISVKW